ncbi:single-strand binding protein [Klebsiella aerogenes]|nr:single-strand binding protein [Klebsiella aerogenes]
MASRGVNKVILVGNLGQDPEYATCQVAALSPTSRWQLPNPWRDKQTGE